MVNKLYLLENMKLQGKIKTIKFYTSILFKFCCMVSVAFVKFASQAIYNTPVGKEFGLWSFS